MNESIIYRIQEILGMKDKEIRCEKKKLCKSFNLSEPQFLICDGKGENTSYIS